MEGCACDCPVCEQPSWRLSLIRVRGDCEPWCPESWSSFQEHRVPGFLGSNLRKGYRSLF